MPSSVLNVLLTALDRVIVFISFENRLVSLGGLTAVSCILPQYIAAAGENVLFLTPLQINNATVKREIENGTLIKCFDNESFHLCDYEGVMGCYQDKTLKVPSYHLYLEGHFSAGDNPYGYEDPQMLLLDSLAFTAAVPLVLKKLGYTKNLIFHANDWETAPVAITSKYAVVSGVLNQARTFLTLHNSFDMGIESGHKLKFFGKDIPGESVLQCSLPLLNGPLTTVSTPFAHELLYDPIQCNAFTSHLQTLFSSNPPIGIENGLFGEDLTPYTDMFTAKKKESISKVLVKKESFREKLISQLNVASDSRIIGKLKFTNDDSRIPVFFMLGRLDLAQKGYDVIFHAFKRLAPGSAKLFFCPSSNNGEQNIAFFREFEKQCSGDIVIWPFRIPAGQYENLLRGASFLIMPSFYEPFGAATEGFIHGTPVVARGTGGLWVQVNSYKKPSIPSYYGNILNVDNGMDLSTGILYRESDVDDSSWTELLKLSPELRTANPIYSAMIDSAEGALKSAADIFSNPALYTKMILNGSRSLKSFSWERSVHKYQKVYDIISYRGS